MSGDETAEAPSVLEVERVDLGFAGFEMVVHAQGAILSVRPDGPLCASISLPWGVAITAAREILHRGPELTNPAGAAARLDTTRVSVQACPIHAGCGNAELRVDVGVPGDTRSILFRLPLAEARRLVGEVASLLPPVGGAPS